MSNENLSPDQYMKQTEAMTTLISRLAQAAHEADEAKIRAELVSKVREAIYDTDRDRNPTVMTAETGPQWGLEPDYRQEDYTAMAEAAVDALADYYRAQLT